MKFVDDHPDLISTSLKTPSLPLVFDILGEHLFASAKAFTAEYLGEERPDLLGSTDTIATFTVGGIIQNLKRYLYGECRDAETLSREMVDTFECLWRGILAS